MHIDLYHSLLCPYSMKVMNYVRKNNLEMFIHTIDVEENPEEADVLQSFTGETQVPCLVVEGEPIVESDEIIKWLSENLHSENNQGLHRTESNSYGDGANTTHYLGNDEYSEGNMIKDAFGSGPKNDKAKAGQVAYGNLPPKP